MEAKNIQNTTISATVIRKNGTKEELGVICEISNEPKILNKIKKIFGGKR